MKRDTLYLFVKSSTNKWVLPSSSVLEDELMHDVADRIGKEVGLNHHVIGRVCVGYCDGTFYMKSRVCAPFHSFIHSFNTQQLL